MEFRTQDHRSKEHQQQTMHARLLLLLSIPFTPLNCPQLSTSGPLSSTCTHTTNMKLLFNKRSTYYRILVTWNRSHKSLYPDSSVANCRDRSAWCYFSWYDRVRHICNNTKDIWFWLWNIFLMAINYTVDWTCIEALLGRGSVDITELPIN